MMYLGIARMDERKFTPMDSKKFSQWLSAARKESGMTQPELAAKAKTSKQYISNLERNSPHPVTGAPPQPSVEIVDNLAKALGVPLSEARLAAGYAPPENEMDSKELQESEIAALFYEYNELSEGDKKELRTVMEVVRQEIRRRKKAGGIPKKKT